MRTPKPHHLIYGTLKDYLTGEELTDTDDKRIRQDLSKLLVEEKGYGREQLHPRQKVETLFSNCFVTSTIEGTVSLQHCSSQPGRNRQLWLKYSPTFPPFHLWFLPVKLMRVDKDRLSHMKNSFS